MSKRMTTDARSDQILACAVQLAADKGLYAVTREDVAKAAGISTGRVSGCFGTMSKLRRSIVKSAVRDENLSVLAAAIAARDAGVAKIPADLRMRALSSLMVS